MYFIVFINHLNISIDTQIMFTVGIEVEISGKPDFII